MKKIKRVIITLGATAAAIFANPRLALAQFVGEPSPLPNINLKPENIPETLTQITPTSLVAGAIKLLLLVAALIFFFILVIGGIQWITAGGDKAGTETARKRITNALIGLAIVFAAWAITALINALFGVNIFELEIPTFF
ncbi:MAG TPA: hypothetical protein VMW25_01945 [Clostridia bacterium]|nr:hypothetical protein [Clostridia bacterium]